MWVAEGRRSASSGDIVPPSLSSPLASRKKGSPLATQISLNADSMRRVKIDSEFIPRIAINLCCLCGLGGPRT